MGDGRPVPGGARPRGEHRPPGGGGWRRPERGAPRRPPCRWQPDPGRERPAGDRSPAELSLDAGRHHPLFQPEPLRARSGLGHPDRLRHARPTTIIEQFPSEWTVDDDGGGTVTGPSAIRFEIAADGPISYTLAAPKALSARFTGKFQVFPCEGQPQDLQVGGAGKLDRAPPGDLAITGAVGRDIGAVAIPGGQEEVSESPIAFNRFASGRTSVAPRTRGRMVACSEPAPRPRCSVHGGGDRPIDPSPGRV
jgi:hypothetical protein